MRGNAGQGWIADAMPYYALFALVVGVLFFLFVFIASSYVGGQYTIPSGLEENITKQRFWTDSCFSAYGLNNRLSFTLDWERFDQTVLDECYKAHEGYPVPAYRLTLGVGNEEKTVMTPGWSSASGNTQAKQYIKDVRVLKNDEMYDGAFIVEVKDEAQ